MSEPRGWDTFCEGLCQIADPGIDLDTSRVPGLREHVEQLAGRVTSAYAAMEALEGGAIANPDEERMVGHYWLRAPELAPRDELGVAIEATVAKVRRFAADVLTGRLVPPTAARFTDVLLVGIGGSALGPQLVVDALGGGGLQVHFLDNTDPDGMDRVLEGLGERLASTLLIVISKSGGTVETRNGMLEAEGAMVAAGLRPGPQAVAVTSAGSRLARHAEETGYIETFPMWDWVGGRTSVLSAVGLLPAALAGVDIDALLAGARTMDAATRTRETWANPAMLLALSWHRLGEGCGSRAMVVLPYKDRLALLGRYLQQLVMESLGKEHDLAGRAVHQGLTVYGNKGSTDQHAYVQQLRDGPDDFFATFVDVLRDREDDSLEVDSGTTSGDYLLGFLLGTREALSERGRASLTLTLADISPGSLGGLIALYERAVGFYASLVEINAYHQPGVEAGKKAAAAVIALQGLALRELRVLNGQPASARELAERLGRPADTETLFHVLRHLAASVHHPVEQVTGGPPDEIRYRLSA